MELLRNKGQKAKQSKSPQKWRSFSDKLSGPRKQRWPLSLFLLLLSVFRRSHQLESVLFVVFKGRPYLVCARQYHFIFPVSYRIDNGLCCYICECVGVFFGFLTHSESPLIRVFFFVGLKANNTCRSCRFLKLCFYCNKWKVGANSGRYCSSFKTVWFLFLFLFFYSLTIKVPFSCLFQCMVLYMVFYCIQRSTPCNHSIYTSFYIFTKLLLSTNISLFFTPWPMCCS